MVFRNVNCSVHPNFGRYYSLPGHCLLRFILRVQSSLNVSNRFLLENSLGVLHRLYHTTQTTCRFLRESPAGDIINAPAVLSIETVMPQLMLNGSKQQPYPRALPTALRLVLLARDLFV